MLAVRPHRATARNTRKNSGFTLLELIVVLLILGVLAAIAIPTFNAIQGNSVAGSLTTTGEAIVRNANAIAASNLSATAAIVTEDNLEVAAQEALGGVAGDPSSWPSNWAGTFGGTAENPTLNLQLTSGNICRELTIGNPDPGNNGGPGGPKGPVAVTIAAAAC